MCSELVSVWSELKGLSLPRRVLGLLGLVVLAVSGELTATNIVGGLVGGIQMATGAAVCMLALRFGRDSAKEREGADEHVSRSRD